VGEHKFREIEASWGLPGGEREYWGRYFEVQIERGCLGWENDFRGDVDGDGSGELSSEKDLRRNLNGTEAIFDEADEEDDGVEPGIAWESCECKDGAKIWLDMVWIKNRDNRAIATGLRLHPNRWGNQKRHANRAWE
jgi:hypothetical protein